MIVSSSVLNTHLEAFIAKASIVLSKRQFSTFNMMFIYGFRFAETQILHTSEFNVLGNIEINTYKGNNKRIYTPAEVHDDIIEQMTLGISYSTELSAQTYRRIFFSLNFNRHYVILGKESTLHIFRHNRIKQMHDLGLSLAQIKAWTGLKQDSTVLRYIDSTVTL